MSDGYSWNSGTKCSKKIGFITNCDKNTNEGSLKAPIYIPPINVMPRQSGNKNLGSGDGNYNLSYSLNNSSETKSFCTKISLNKCQIHNISINPTDNTNFAVKFKGETYSLLTITIFFPCQHVFGNNMIKSDIMDETDSKNTTRPAGEMQMKFVDSSKSGKILFICVPLLDAKKNNMGYSNFKFNEILNKWAKVTQPCDTDQVTIQALYTSNSDDIIGINDLIPNNSYYFYQALPNYFISKPDNNSLETNKDSACENLASYIVFSNIDPVQNRTQHGMAPPLFYIDTTNYKWGETTNLKVNKNYTGSKNAPSERISLHIKPPSVDSDGTTGEKHSDKIFIKCNPIIDKDDAETEFLKSVPNIDFNTMFDEKTQSYIYIAIGTVIAAMIIFFIIFKTPGNKAKTSIEKGMKKAVGV